ncbi:hypothetical protein [Yinghuangia soli]|uniref:Uncharacterized protein n=1 Tax=Yinghuangia soli TaxID=2908204 RepID=A0AA41Q8A2_9ACTN|nr:hypothetical protein [Yinghuangia soli]MCF2533288.1 hypothetical protein [Yinghuangia soli]
MRSPISLPDGARPPGVEPWLTADAERWAKARPPRGLHPAWPAAAMVAATVIVCLTAPPAACDSVGVCAPEPSGQVVFGFAALYVAALLRCIWLAAPAGAAVLAGCVVWMSEGGLDAWHVWCMAAAVAWGFAAAAAEFAVSRRRRRLFASASQAPTPSAAWHRRTFVRRSSAAAVLLGAGVLCAVIGAGRTPDPEHASTTSASGGLYGYGLFGQAEGTSGQLPIPFTLMGESSGLVPGPFESYQHDGVLYTNPYFYASAPRDISPLTWAGILAAAPALTFLVGALRIPSSAAQLLRGQVPARLVRVREQSPGVTVVYPADDEYGRTPLFVCRVPLPAGADADTMHEAVLHGRPRADGAVALTVPDAACPDGTCTEITASGIRLIPTSERAPYRPRGLEVTAEQMGERDAPVAWSLTGRSVSADALGVRLSTPWRHRTVPWDDVVRVSYRPHTLLVTTTRGHRHSLHGPSELAHAAAVLDAMRAHPALRPSEEDAHAAAPRFWFLLPIAAIAILTAYLLT